MVREGDVVESDLIANPTQGIVRSLERVLGNGWSGEGSFLSMDWSDGGPEYDRPCGFRAFRSIRGWVMGEWQQHETYCFVGTFAFF